MLDRGKKTATEIVTVEGGTLEKELFYSCNDGFILYPNESVRTCQSNANWSSETELTCLAGKMTVQHYTKKFLFVILNF